MKTVRGDVQVIRDTVAAHVAKEDVIFEVFKRALHLGVTVTSALVALLVSVIGYLLSTRSVCTERTCIVFFGAAYRRPLHLV